VEIVPSLLCMDSLGISIGVKEDDGADGADDSDDADGATDGATDGADGADGADDSDGKEDGADDNISEDESEASASVNLVF